MEKEEESSEVKDQSQREELTLSTKQVKSMRHFQWLNE